ncbi:MAG: DMT family transporter [Meiothermus sp.]|nr:DMT family transporter [Meiothermus sp.]
MAAVTFAWGLFTMVVITVIWASSFVVTKDTLGLIPVALLAALRSSLALASLAWVRPDRHSRLPGLWLGLLATCGFICLLIGLTSTSASKAAFIASLNALGAPLVSVWLFRRAVPGRIYAATGVALLGLGLMTLAGQSGVNPGDLWCLAGAVFFSFYIAYVGEVARKTSALVIAQTQYLVMTAVTVVWAWPHLPRVLEFEPQTWLVVLYLGIVCTSLPTVLQVWAQRAVPAYLAGLLFILEPVFASVLAFLWIGEVLSAVDWLGGGLVLAALLIGTLPVGSAPKVQTVPDSKSA